MRKLILPALLLCLVVLNSCCTKQTCSIEGNSNTQFTSLFNGRNLDG